MSISTINYDFTTNFNHLKTKKRIPSVLINGESADKKEPKAGLEPATYSLRMSYSTN